MIDAVIVDNQIDWIVHFSTILSALGEAQVPMALRINCEGVQNILQISRCVS
jgi:threonine 3-dehydrogenase